MAQMVSGQASRIRSGWKCVFGVFHCAAAETDQGLVELAFSATADVVSGRYADPPLPALLDSFAEAVACLSEFACNAAFPDISMEAIRLIRLCARYVAEGSDLFAEAAIDDGSGVPEDDRVWLRGWFPIVFELSCIISRCKLDVRTRGLTVMFEIMKTYGGSFKAAWWRDLFGVAFKIFNVMKLPEAQTERAEWMMTTCNHALYAIVDVFSQYFDSLADLVLPDLYEQLQACIQSENEQLARSAIFCLENLVVTNGFRFNDATWARTVALFLEVFHWSRPACLLTWKPHVAAARVANDAAEDDADGDITQMPQPSSPSSHSNDANVNQSLFSQEVMFAGLRMRCVVQLETIEAVHAVLFGPGAARKDERSVEAPPTSGKSPARQPPGLLFSGMESSLEQGEEGESLKGGLSAPANARRNFGGRTEWGGCETEESEAGMWGRLRTEQLLQLADALIEAHDLAKAFNEDQAQRTLLWKAGLGRSKPNLVHQETRALRYGLKILFRLYSEPQRAGGEQVQNRLISVCRNALDYYLRLQAQAHRKDWLFLLHLILHRTHQLPPDQFKKVHAALAEPIGDLLEQEQQPALRREIRKYYNRLVTP